MHRLIPFLLARYGRSHRQQHFPAAATVDREATITHGVGDAGARDGERPTAGIARSSRIGGRPGTEGHLRAQQRAAVKALEALDGDLVANVATTDVLAEERVAAGAAGHP